MHWSGDSMKGCRVNFPRHIDILQSSGFRRRSRSPELTIFEEDDPILVGVREKRSSTPAMGDRALPGLGAKRLRRTKQTRSSANSNWLAFERDFG
jgi:hypothetical protein